MKKSTFFDRIMEVREFETRKEIYNSIMNVLLTGKAVIEFYKVNGEYRVLTCTMNAYYIDERDIQSFRNYKIDDEYKYITVYDIVEYKFKKICIDNVVKITNYV